MAKGKRRGAAVVPHGDDDGTGTMVRGYLSDFHITGIRMRSMLLWLIGIPIPIIIILWLIAGHA